MGFCYNDVAIYPDSMIYSNLTCFYQIKFIFCTMSTGLLAVFMNLIFFLFLSLLTPPQSQKDISPFCDKCEYL